MTPKDPPALAIVPFGFTSIRTIDLHTLAPLSDEPLEVAPGGFAVAWFMGDEPRQKVYATCRVVANTDSILRFWKAGT